MPKKFRFETPAPEESKTEREQDLGDLAKRAQELFAKNEFAQALEILEKIKEQAVPEAEKERTVEGLKELKEVREVFKENFLGIEEAEKFTGYKLNEKEQKLALQKWQEKVREQKLTKESLEQLEEEGFMVVFRPSKLMLEGKKKGEKVEVPITIENLRKKYGKLFYEQEWYDDEDFAKKEKVEFSWSVVKKEILEESRNKDWDEQEKVLKDWAKEHKVDSKFVKRRTPPEVAYDVLVYHDARKERILEEDFDWTSVQSSGGLFVYVGVFQPAGLLVHDREDRLYVLGVCPSR